MKSKIEKYLLEKTDKLVFLAVDERIFQENELLSSLKNIEIPVFTSKILELSIDEKKGITTMDALSAMLYIIGIDSSFKYKKQYLEFLSNIIKEPVSLISSLAGKSYEEGNLIDSIIFSKAGIENFEPSKELLYNYALLCQQKSSAIEDEAEKTDFMLESEDKFKLLTNVFPDTAMAYYYLAYHMLNYNDSREAENLFRKASEYGLSKEYQEDTLRMIASLGSEEYIRLAKEDIEDENYSSAEQRLLKALEFNETSYEALFYLGYINRINADYEKSIDFYERAFAINSKEPKLINEMALDFAFLGDFEQASELLHYALELDNESIEILCNLSMVYLNIDNIDNAVKYIRKAMDINSEDPIVVSCFNEIKKYY